MYNLPFQKDDNDESNTQFQKIYAHKILIKYINKYIDLRDKNYKSKPMHPKPYKKEFYAFRYIDRCVGQKA